MAGTGPYVYTINAPMVNLPAGDYLVRIQVSPVGTT